jgi:cyclic pyranopterin phosphate synthase
MPAEGMVWLPKTEVLTFEEIERLARIVVEHFGVDGIRLTGGEPTMRAHLPVLVAKLAALSVPKDSASPLAGQPIDLAITTNGATLANCVDELKLAGIARVNISLDTLDRAKFEQMTRRDELPRVLAGIDAAIGAGFSSVKINAVVERGVNDNEILDLAEFGRAKGVEVRFIEFMPLDAEGHWLSDKVVSQDEIVEQIAQVHPLELIPARGAAPADRWRYLDGKGSVGVIPSVTKPFCGDCDRVRITADGRLRTCLLLAMAHCRTTMTPGRDGVEVPCAPQPMLQHRPPMRSHTHRHRPRPHRLSSRNRKARRSGASVGAGVEESARKPARKPAQVQEKDSWRLLSQDILICMEE